LLFEVLLTSLTVTEFTLLTYRAFSITLCHRKQNYN